MAKYVAEGRGVTLVTCTAGEMGEILVPELEHLAADQDDGLGEHRRGELADAMKALGVTDHRFLGGFGTYRDSGMKWHEDGHADRRRRRPRQRVLARRPHRGRRPPGRDHPRGPAAGAGHLRPVRRLRPPRPHPGAPGRDVRRRSWPPCRRTGATSASRGTSPRSTGARCPRAGCARACGRCATPGTPPRFEGMDPDGPLPPFVTPDENLAAGGRRRATTSSRRWRRWRPTPPRSPPTARSSRCPTTSAAPSGAPSSTGSSRAQRGELDEDGLETDLFAGV